MRPLSPAPVGGGVIGDPSPRILRRRHRYWNRTDPETSRWTGTQIRSGRVGILDWSDDGTGPGGGGATGNGGRVGHVEKG